MNQEKAWWNKYVFKCFLNEFKESAFGKDAGMLFHNLSCNRKSSVTLRLKLRSRDLK